MPDKKDFLIHKCPLCDSERIEYRFIAHGRVISACTDCGHLFANPQSTENFSVPRLYSEEKFEAFIKKYSKSEKDVFKIDNLDLVNSPVNLLNSIHEKLNENGELFLFIPILESRNAKRNSQKWTAFEQERPNFFGFKTLNNVLCKCGFGDIVTETANDDGIFVKAVRKEHRKILSFIIPVYNEKNTVLELLETVYKKDFEHLGLKKEIIIIESNSKDGTREIVKDFAEHHQDVKLILEDSPKGKGHAVRNGFKAVTGEFITIQDGDLEYDINDYDKLLLPLINYREAFVLGSRHTGDWHMRKFGAGEKFNALLMNAGQILFTGLINFGCGTKLKDPFTMFKLFRRECLYGLKFDGNRFEIDWEIVIKFIRKKFIPLEIPVNYKSRGINEGKKIKILKDPILWLINFVRYRYLYKI